MRSVSSHTSSPLRPSVLHLRSKVAVSGHPPLHKCSVARSSSLAIESQSESELRADRQASGRDASTSGREYTDAGYLEFPARKEGPRSEQAPPQKVRVRLSVHYRVHSRQLLCIGGSQLPFGWSFLSIANVPMEWNPGDVWTTEDWTIQVSRDAEGLVTFEYRTQPEGPPDVQQIQKQMAIVAWQPGPNRYVQVPSQEEVQSLQPGEVRQREPARAPKQNQISRTYGQQAKGGQNPSVSDMSLPLLARVAIANRGQRVGSSQDADEMAGTWENLSLDSDGVPLLERRDVWGLLREELDPGKLRPESES